jgi:biotin carboxyl carrier protein
MADDRLERTDARGIMAVYRISIGDNEYEIEITGSQMTINGEPVHANLQSLDENGLYRLDHAGGKLELHLRFEEDNTYLAMADGRQILARVEQDKGQPHRPSMKRDTGDLVAPMPGKVIRVSVEEGDTVEQGQVVVVLESMKMQMVIHAPITGVVEHIAVEPDQDVEKNELLIRVIQQSSG